MKYNGMSLTQFKRYVDNQRSSAGITIIDILPAFLFFSGALLIGILMTIIGAFL